MKDDTLAYELGLKLKKRGWTLAIAESCTGGLLGDRITNIPGSSEYFLGGVIAYSNQVKVNILKVKADEFETRGAVSPEVAMSMARGAKRVMGASVGLAITGIAGPGGGTVQKPIGLVLIAVITPEKESVQEFYLKGNRLEIKKQASEKALEVALADF